MNKEKSESKKLIPLYLQKLFLEKTDKTHYVRMPDILSYLESKNIFADRRTIYAAISLLNYTDFEIVGVQEKGNYKYHHPSRLFNTNELKFLIDSIAASKFLTEKKSKDLISKVKSLGSSFDAKSLNRNILLSKRIKSMNDKVLRNLDYIYSAIADNKQITFQYLQWNTKRKLVIKSEKLYAVSPYAVSLSDDNYYLIAFDSKSNDLRHYRIDKMQSITITNTERIGKELFQSFDIVDYSRNYLVSVFIDRFRESANIRPNFNNPDSFIVRITVNISPQFFAWVFGLGKNVKILSPDSTADAFKSMINSVAENYCR